jgi:hypothetical protein
MVLELNDSQPEDRLDTFVGERETGRREGRELRR